MEQVSIWQRLDLMARGLAPLSITFLLMIATVLPTRTPEIAPVMPALVLTAVYYWAIFRPDLLPIWLVFLLGIVHDLLTGAPLGLGAAVFLTAYLAVAAQRRFFAHATFAMLWAGFLLVAAMALTVEWLFGSLLQLRLVDPLETLLRYAATVAAYPCLAWLFGRAQQAFLK
ncbi:rod shape-determining protein MreD [Algihabitans albus]|uniref:rod shape-determining protein MreD n=1 Tax=Algihabitans albus TaxID=2164067 RepID=UPI000E5C7427|nr:rod shape-determining protein MreD [Algihabitans albus]